MHCLEFNAPFVLPFSQILTIIIALFGKYDVIRLLVNIFQKGSKICSKI